MATRQFISTIRGRLTLAIAITILGVVCVVMVNALDLFRRLENVKAVEAIRAAGGEPKYTEYPAVGHDSWTRTYADDAFHDWLFAQRRTGD